VRLLAHYAQILVSTSSSSTSHRCQLGFLVHIPQRHLKDGATGELIEPPAGLRYYCTNDKEAKFYFKDTDTDYLDETIGDLDGLIKETEANIVSELQDDILDQETELRETFLALSELDCIISFAVVAKDRHLTRPNILLPSPQGGASQTSVRIKNGRHPLQEIIAGRDYVPNDIEIDDKKLVNVLTGPNFSGQLLCLALHIA
jgi:DNA mismatch repair protein MSH5